MPGMCVRKIVVSPNSIAKAEVRTDYGRVSQMSLREGYCAAVLRFAGNGGPSRDGKYLELTLNFKRDWILLVFGN